MVDVQYMAASIMETSPETFCEERISFCPISVLSILRLFKVERFFEFDGIHLNFMENPKLVELTSTRLLHYLKANRFRTSDFDFPFIHEKALECDFDV